MESNFTNRGMFLKASLTAALFLSLPSSALTIENKSEYPARVEIKDDRFRVIEKTRIEAESSYEFLDEERREDSFNIEAYVEDPADVLGTPTFLHEIKYKDKVCVPIDVCTEEDHKKKKKKKGGGFKIF